MMRQSIFLQRAPVRDFSLKMRKVREKQKPTRKFRLKTKKAFQKRYRICGGLRNKMFKFHAPGYRHLNRNKTNQNLKRRRSRFLHNLMDVKKAKKFMPYFKRRKYLM
jgi:ribosomal protein L35